MKLTVDFETISPTGRLVPSSQLQAYQLGAVSGRWSASGPTLSQLPKHSFAPPASGALPSPSQHECGLVRAWLAQNGTNHKQRAKIYLRAATLAKLAGVKFQGRVFHTDGWSGPKTAPLTPAQIGLGWLALDHPARVESLFGVMTSSGELVRATRPGTRR